MIADASEAVVRSLPKRTPEAVEKAIRGIIEERMDLEQFSDCDITMADLSIIRRTLVSTLTGVYHHRVKYPSIRYKHEDGKTTGKTNDRFPHFLRKRGVPPKITCARWSGRWTAS